MRNTLAILLLCVIASFFGLGVHGILTYQAPSHLREEMVATVLIVTDRDSIGSGVVVSSQGYILTCYHVVEDTSQLTIHFLNSDTAFEAQVIDVEPNYDLALIRVDHMPQGTPVASFWDGGTEVDYENLIGEPVWAVGHPEGLYWTMTEGIVSQVRKLGSNPFLFFIQTSAAINPGNSGGGLFNNKGEVIGIVSRMLSATEQNAGLNFAIPSKYCLWFISRLNRKSLPPVEHQSALPH